MRMTYKREGRGGASGGITTYVDGVIATYYMCAYRHIHTWCYRHVEAYDFDSDFEK